jgi:hypothetical protein
MSTNKYNASNEPDGHAAIRAELDAKLDAGDRALLDLVDASALRDRAELPAGFADRLFGASIEAYRGATPVRLVHGAGRSRAGAAPGPNFSGLAGSRRLLSPLRLAAAVAFFATIAAAMLAGGGRDRAENHAGGNDSGTLDTPIVNAAGVDEFPMDEAADPSGVAGLLALALSPDDGVAAEIDQLRLDSMLISGVLLDDSFALPLAGDLELEHDAGASGSSM